VVSARTYTTHQKARRNSEHRGTTSGSNAFGKLIEARRYNYPFDPTSAWTISESYAYNGVLGALSQRTTQIQFPTNPVGSQFGEAFTQQWSYTPLGQVATATYPVCIATPQQTSLQYCNDGNDQVPLAHTVTSQYNQGLPARVTSNRGPWADFEYNPNLTLARIGHSNGVEDLHDEDPEGQARPRRIRIKKAGSTTYYDTGGYQYDEAGNIWAIGPDRYTYDQVGRLTSGQMLRFGTNVREDYTYDPNDNLLSLHRLSDPAPLNWTVDAKNRVRGPLNDPNNIFYDGAGNTVNIAKHSNGLPVYVMAYDALNMQTSFTGQSSTGVPSQDYRYVYGPGNYRFLVWDGATRTVTLRGLDNKPQRRYVVTGFGTGAQWDWQQDSIYGPNGIFATTRSDGNTWHYHPDHLGSPRILTSQFGTYIAEHHYHPYGAEHYRYGPGRPDDPAAKFTGHERDANGVTDYMLGRTYVFPLGRFGSVDPARDGWNLYGYVGANPMGAVDPTGLGEVKVYQGGVVIHHGFLADEIVYWGENADQFAENYRRTHTVRGVMTTVALALGIIRAVEGDDDFAAPPEESNNPEEGYAPDRSLPADDHGNSIPESEQPHTQLGKRTSKRTGETYRQAREYDGNGKKVRDIDFTDHKRPAQHTNPHQHRYDPQTGKRGGPEPVPQQEN